jgi:hypothetical protein
MFLLVRASKDSREPPKKKKIIPQSIIKWRLLCNSLMEEIQNAVHIPNADSEANPQASKEIFRGLVDFMDSLVEVTKDMLAMGPDQYGT